MHGIAWTLFTPEEIELFGLVTWLVQRVHDLAPYNTTFNMGEGHLTLHHDIFENGSEELSVCLSEDSHDDGLWFAAFQDGEDFKIEGYGAPQRENYGRPEPAEYLPWLDRLRALKAQFTN